MAARSSLDGQGLVERLDDRLERLELADRRLGLLLVVPEAGRGHFLLDRLDAGFFVERSQRESRSWTMAVRIASARSYHSFSSAIGGTPAKGSGGGECGHYTRRSGGVLVEPLPASPKTWTVARRHNCS